MVSIGFLNVLEPALSPIYFRLALVIASITCQYQVPKISEIPKYNITIQT
jgi:hypothetical protein